jgi:hypothetical protein
MTARARRAVILSKARDPRAFEPGIPRPTGPGMTQKS